MSTCPNCNAEVAEGLNFCGNCGAPQQPGMVAAQAQPDYAMPGNPPAVQSTFAPKPAKDRSIALILEIFPGLFGFLGFGWIYAGNTQTGVIILIANFLWLVCAACASVATYGFALICTIPIEIAILALSAINLNKYTHQHPELFGN
jgi:TM2 domain-containing membrane protein YozV